MLYTGADTFEVICPSGAVQKLRCTLCIVKLACHCYIQSDTQFLQPHASNCDRRVSETTVEHPVNLPALAHFLSDLSLSNINSKSFFKDMDKTDIYHLNIISRHLEDVLQQEEINHISVKHVAEAIKRDLKVYIYATSKLLTNLGYSSNTIVAQSTPIISWIAMIMASIVLVLTIYANCRVMAIIPGAYGFKLQLDDQLQDNTPPSAPLSTNIFYHDLYRFIHSLSNAIIVLVIIIMMATIYYIYCKYVSGRQREKQLPVHTVLLVALYTKDDAFTKHLMITPLHPSKIKLLNLRNFQPPTLSGWTTLQFNWSFLRAPITLSKSIDISITDHFKVKKCLAELYAL